MLLCNENRLADIAMGGVEPSIKMDDTLDLIVVVYRTDMSPNSNIPVVVWRRRQTALQVFGHRMHFLAQVLIEHGTLPQRDS
jgi:hypothetical protein